MTDSEHKHFGAPGIGGSLGKCVICGKTFLVEIVMGKSVDSVKFSGISQMCYLHEKCGKLLKTITTDNGAIDCEKLPDGPLKELYQKSKKEVT